MTAKLIVTSSGADAGKDFELKAKELVVVGRDSDCNVVLADARVSRIHCRIYHDAKSTRFWDAGSRTGTRLNGVKLAEGKLHNGDLLTLGRTSLRYESDSAGDDSGEEVYGIKSVNKDIPYDIPQFERRIVVHSRRMRPVGLAPDDTGPQEDERPRKRNKKRKTLPETANLVELAGANMGQYEIGEVLSISPRGVRFFAYDEEHGRRVVLKILWPEAIKQPESAEQFVAVIKKAVPIRHENLLSLYDAGITGSYVWTVSEYVPGENLAHIIEQVSLGRKVSWEHAFRMTLHVARALEVVFAHNMVHQGINASRILYRPRDLITKLADLGLSDALKTISFAQNVEARETFDELPYWAPEETDSSRPRDCRTDIYRLGAVIYAVLTGRPPVKIKTPEETRKLIRTEPPPPPGKFHKSLPPLFEATILQMLAKDPLERFETPTFLVGDLEHVAKFQKIQNLL